MYFIRMPEVEVPVKIRSNNLNFEYFNKKYYLLQVLFMLAHWRLRTTITSLKNDQSIFLKWRITVNLTHLFFFLRGNNF